MPVMIFSRCVVSVYLVWLIRRYAARMMKSGITVQNRSPQIRNVPKFTHCDGCPSHNVCSSKAIPPVTSIVSESGRDPACGVLSHEFDHPSDHPPSETERDGPRHPESLALRN